MNKLLIRATLFLSICLGVVCISQAQNAPTSFRGILDFSAFDSEIPEVIDLSGQWEFYWQKLIHASAFDTLRLSPSYFPVPSVWNGAVLNDSTLSGFGYATYRLKVFGAFKGKQLAAEVPAVYNAYRLWLNGKELSSNGSPGISYENSIPQWLPLTKAFVSDSDTLDLVMHVSNFRHKKGGVSDPILIGSAEKLVERRNSRMTGSWMLIIGLIVIGAGFLIFYLSSNHDMSLLLFSCLCLDWSLRAFSSDLYLLNFYFQGIDWAIAMKIEYITLYLAVIFGLMFIAQSYPSEANKLFRNIGVIISVFFVLITIVVSNLVVSYMLTPFLVFSGLIMTYVINIMFNAAINARHGAIFNSLGALFLIIVWFYDLLAYHGFFSVNHIILNLGYLITFSVYALALVYKKKRTA